MKNLQETDEVMQTKIQRIDTVKYNPQMFHRELSGTNVFNILGGAPSCGCAAVGGLLSYGYYASQPRQVNAYINAIRAQTRFAFGAMLGLALGYKFFGDRQQLHNAFLAERLRARYPESMELHTTDLWRFKGVKAPHEFYRWA
jgi:hypothetical protein